VNLTSRVCDILTYTYCIAVEHVGHWPLEMWVNLHLCVIPALLVLTA